MGLFGIRSRRKKVIEILKSPFEWRGEDNRNLVRRYFEYPLDTIDKETAKLIISYKPVEYQREWNGFLLELRNRLARRAFLVNAGKLAVKTTLALAGVEMVMKYLGLANAFSAERQPGDSLDKKTMLSKLGLGYGYRYSVEFIRAVYNTTFSRNYKKGCPLALFVVNGDDPNLAFDANENYNKFIKGYRILMFIPISDNKMAHLIRDVSSRHGLISCLIIAGHGNQYSLNLFVGNRSAALDIFDVRILRAISPCLSADCQIVLDSCLTGKGNLNLAKAMSDTLGRTVYAARETTHSVDFIFDNRNRFVRAELYHHLHPVTVKYSPSQGSPKLADFLDYFIRVLKQQRQPGQSLPPPSASEKRALKYFGENYTVNELFDLVLVFSRLGYAKGI